MECVLEFYGHAASLTTATEGEVCGLHRNREGGREREREGGGEKDINGENWALGQAPALQYWRGEKGYKKKE